MPGKDTGSGRVLENTVRPALERHYNDRYSDRPTRLPEPGLGGRHHWVDVLLDREDGKQILISLKYQGISGSIDEKVPYECIKLIHAIEQSNGKYPYAYIIIAGPGFSKKLRDYYLSGELARHIKGYELIRIITLDEYLELANRKKL